MSAAEEAAPLVTASGRAGRAIQAVLAGLATAALAALVLLPLADLVAARVFWRGLPGAGAFANHSVLVLTFISAAIASLNRRHLSLGGPNPARGGMALASAAFSDLFAAAAQASLFWAALSFVAEGFSAGSRVGRIPAEVFAAAMPLGLLVMTASTVLGNGLAPARRAAGAAGILLGSILASSSIRNLAGIALGAAPAFLESLSAWTQSVVAAAAVPLILLYILSAFLGAPLFTMLGGVAVILYVGSGSYLELAPSEAYSLLRGGSIAPIPLFALVGFLLAETGAGKRLIAVLDCLFGWIRGGQAVVAVLACTFFTTFTGANGVTILALGGLLAAAITESGQYPEDKARGLVTASGAIGLLLPPSAAVIVYGINAQFIYSASGGFDIVGLFKAALIPGLILVVAMCAQGILASRKTPVRRHRPTMAAVKATVGPAWLELLVPGIAIVLYFSGLAGLTEVGAVCVLYIALVETLAKKELDLKTLVSAVAKSLPILGGTLAILAVARGLSYYVIDADVPSMFAAFVTERISSRFVFLIALNVLLLIVGCLMDIYSAILVVAPLLIPLAAAYGIAPLHFGVIFIMNLCIGFLTPPVGMNLFLASYAFKKPLAQVVRETLPFLFVQLAVLIIVTYIPGLSMMIK